MTRGLTPRWPSLTYLEEHYFLTGSPNQPVLSLVFLRDSVPVKRTLTNSVYQSF